MEIFHEIWLRDRENDPDQYEYKYILENGVRCLDKLVPTSIDKIFGKRRPGGKSKRSGCY